MHPKSHITYLKVSNAILPELPRFFGGFRSALGEVFQNAYRAGAKVVLVNYSETLHTLIISDDGPGCDPEKLLTAGEKGWTSPEIVDPAGVGAFSLLRPEYIDRVVYESSGRWNWRMELDAQSLLGAPIEVVNLDPPPGGKTGLTITLTLNEKQKVTRDDIRHAKGFYPFEVLWMDEQGSVEKIERIETWPSVQLALDIPGIGKVELTYQIKDTYESTERTVVWQCIPIESKAFKEALGEAVSSHPHTDVLQALLPRRMRLFVDTNAGIRAKLPDRNEIIKDQHLDAAARAIVDALFQICDKELREVAKKWPDEMKHFGDSHGFSRDEAPCTGWFKDLISHAGSSGRKAILRHLGYQEVHYTDPTTYNAYEMDDGDGDYLNLEWGSETRYLRCPPLPLVDNEVLNVSLNMQGHPVVMKSNDPNAQPAGVKIVNLQFTTDSRYFAIADQILVDGIGPVPYLINLEPDDWGIDDIDQHPEAPEELVIVYAKSPIDFLDESNESLWIGSIAIAVDQRDSIGCSEYADEGYGECCLATDKIVADLEAEAMSYLSAQAAALRAEEFEIRKVCADLYKEKRDIEYALSDLKRIHLAGAMISPIADRVRAALAEIDAAAADMSLQANQLKASLSAQALANGNQQAPIPVSLPVQALSEASD